MWDFVIKEFSIVFLVFVVMCVLACVCNGQEVSYSTRMYKNGYPLIPVVIVSQDCNKNT